MAAPHVWIVFSDPIPSPARIAETVTENIGLPVIVTEPPEEPRQQCTYLAFEAFPKECVEIEGPLYFRQTQFGSVSFIPQPHEIPDMHTFSITKAHDNAHFLFENILMVVEELGGQIGLHKKYESEYPKRKIPIRHKKISLRKLKRMRRTDVFLSLLGLLPITLVFICLVPFLPLILVIGMIWELKKEKSL